MQLVNGAGIAEWVAARIPYVDAFGPHEALGVINDRGELIAGVVYSEYRGANIEMSVAAVAHGWAKFLPEFFAYPFHGLKVRRVTATIARKNKKAQKLVRHIGFMHEGTLHDALDDDDALIFGMTRKWYLRSKWNGQKSAKSTRPHVSS